MRGCRPRVGEAASIKISREPSMTMRDGRVHVSPGERCAGACPCSGLAMPQKLLILLDFLGIKPRGRSMGRWEDGPPVPPVRRRVYGLIQKFCFIKMNEYKKISESFDALFQLNGNIDGLTAF